MSPAAEKSQGWIEDVEEQEATWGSVSIKGGACKAQHRQSLNSDVAGACRRMRRALYLMEHYHPEIEEMYKGGINFTVYFANRAFYLKRLRSRVKACDTGTIYLKCVGRCGTSRDTLAYVLVTLGWVHSTINICDEYFSDRAETRVGTMAHEYGRLEDIGDSPKFDTNNIYVWDAIVRALSDDLAYKMILESRIED